MKGEFYNFALAAQLIERYCEEHKINESDYAALLQVHPASLSRIKAGKACSPEILAKIAALGKVSVKDLVNESPQSVKDQLFAVGKSKSIPVCV